MVIVFFFSIHSVIIFSTLSAPCSSIGKRRQLTTKLAKQRNWANMYITNFYGKYVCGDTKKTRCVCVNYFCHLYTHEKIECALQSTTSVLHTTQRERVESVGGFSGYLHEINLCMWYAVCGPSGASAFLLAQLTTAIFALVQRILLIVTARGTYMFPRPVFAPITPPHFHM